MRRMLDPKELGGGDEKLYCHHMEVNPKDGGEIFFDYYSKNGTKLTKETIISALEGKKLICGGYVMVRDSAKSLEYVYILRKMLTVKWIDMATLANSTKEIDISYIDDAVFPVS